MKKLMLILGVCFLLVAMPTLSALPMRAPKTHHLDTVMEEQAIESKEPIQPMDVPEWAEGNLTGLWGVNVLGQPLEPIGWLYGFYGTYQFAAAFWVFNESEISGYIGGLHIGPFLLGKIVFPDENETLFVGLGGRNETHFYYRLMGIVGPTFYIYGIHIKF